MTSGSQHAKTIASSTYYDPPAPDPKRPSAHLRIAHRNQFRPSNVRVRRQGLPELQVSNGSFTDPFAPHDAHIYRFKLPS